MTASSIDFPLLSLGLIGPRGFGSFCTGAYHEASVAYVVAFAGRDKAVLAAAAQQYNVPNTYTDWREMLADPAVEAVHIVTPPDKHAEMAIAALRAGKHVFVEKPLATTAADAQAILTAARASGKVAGINFVMRYDPLYRSVLAIARAGWLGPLTHVGFENYASDEGLGNDHWFWDLDASGGIFIEHGVHFFDIIGAIAGAPARDVLGQTWTRPDGTQKEDRVQALVTYENGIEASFYHAFNRPGALEKQTAHFAFERGHIMLNGWIPTSLDLTAIVDDAGFAGLQSMLPLEVVNDGDFPAPGRVVRGNGKPYEVTRRIRAHQSLGGPTPVYLKAVQDAMADFALTVCNPSHQPLVTAQDGAASVRLAAAARESAILGRVVKL
ncbi:MAG: Gfo/Idh/MocA family protein [Janthinobacterium lividum]